MCHRCVIIRHWHIQGTICTASGDTRCGRYGFSQSICSTDLESRGINAIAVRYSARICGAQRRAIQRSATVHVHRGRCSVSCSGRYFDCVAYGDPCGHQPTPHALVGCHQSCCYHAHWQQVSPQTTLQHACPQTMRRLSRRMYRALVASLIARAGSDNELTPPYCHCVSACSRAALAEPASPGG